MRWRVWAGVAAAVITLVGVGGITVPETYLTFRNYTTEYSTPGAEAQDVLYWVPLATDLSGLNAYGSESGACSARLTKWLNTHGSDVMFAQWIQITNASSAKETIRLGVAANGRSATVTPGFYVQCGTPEYGAVGTNAPKGALAWQPLYVDFTSSAVASTPEGIVSPAGHTLTLDSDASTGVELLFEGSGGYHGSLLATVQGVNSTPEQIPLRLNNHLVSSIDWPGVPMDQTILVRPMTDADGSDSELYCTYRSGTAPHYFLPWSLCDGETIRLIMSNIEAARLSNLFSEPGKD